MTGKFKDCNNVFLTCIAFVTLFGLMFCGVVILSKYDIPCGLLIMVILILVILRVEDLLLGQCSFTADNNKLIFRVGPLKYKYKYSEIKSAEAGTGFTSRGLAYIELVITLANGETETFCDVIPAEALSTPEKHKEFYDSHRFTKLSYYINERAGKPDSKI